MMVAGLMAYLESVDWRPGVVEIMAGRSSSFAVLADGTIRAWGDNSLYQLGTGVAIACLVDAARLLVQRAAFLKDAREEVTTAASMAKLYASEMAVRVTNRAVQVHGGCGYVKEYPVERAYRDARIATIGEGTSEIQRLVIARRLLGQTREQAP